MISSLMRKPNAWGAFHSCKLHVAILLSACRSVRDFVSILYYTCTARSYTQNFSSLLQTMNAHPGQLWSGKETRWFEKKALFKLVHSYVILHPHCVKTRLF